MLFSELGLGEKLQDAIRNAGYIEPTPIQEQAIPFVLQGRDVLGCAQTGTGKTASFVLPMIEKLASGRARARMPRSMILEPTRELAAQVQDNFEKYGAQHKLSTCLIIGGESMAEQTRKLDRGVDVLIATPGRLIDQFERGNILMTDIRLLVIDECDRMLDMGFIPDIEKIVARLPRTRQTLLFSATLPPEIRRLADSFLSNPQEITVAPPASTAGNIEQGIVMVDAAGKRDALLHLLKAEDVRNAFIFCNRKRDIAALEKTLQKAGYKAGALHGDMVQSARQKTLESFKSGEILLMVCSDVAARGIDVEGVSHVFNFDVPHHAEDYVHRIGRTGRAGNTGKAYMIATPDEEKNVAAIVHLIGKPIPLITVPGDQRRALASAPQETAEPAGEIRHARPRRGRGGTKPEAASDAPRASGRTRREPAPAKPREGRPAAPPPHPEPAPQPVNARDDRYRPDRSHGEPRPDHGRRDRPQRPDNRDHRSDNRQNRNDRPNYRNRDYDDDQNESVVGFGDHLPAFLRDAPRLPKLNEAVAAED